MQLFWNHLSISSLNHFDSLQMSELFRTFPGKILQIRKFKVALNPLRRNFLNFARSCVLSCWLQFDNKTWGSPCLFLSFEHLKLKLGEFLAGHSVAMVTYCVTKIIPTCSPMIGQFFDTMLVASIDKVWSVIMTHQNQSLDTCWKLFWATLSPS